MSIIYNNGDYQSDQQAKVSIYDRSFLFGEGLFESFRSFDGQIPFLKDHLNRLEWSSTFLNMEFPDDLDFSKILQNLLTQNEIKEARFKIVLSRVGLSCLDMTIDPTSKLDAPLKTNILIYCFPLSKNLPQATYKLKTIKNFTNDSLPISTIKSTNYLVKSMAKRSAIESGFDDGILLNKHGNVTETSTANIFWIDEDAKLWTILPEQGYLSGVMQKKLKDCLDKCKINHKEGVITPEQLSSSREVFITNSVIGIKPIVAIDNRQISGGEIGSITTMLMDNWEKYLKEICN
ncbi:hypothetical protein BVY03_01875 [bacterium K02(2017)]|nr:hypothetical protein BVY03_01875 [bacterium K02(2017)]